MKRLGQILLIVVVGMMMSGCFAEKTYMGKVDVVGIGAGPKPSSSNANSVNPSKLPNITVVYADKIQAKVQDVGGKTKYVLGEGLTKDYSGEPKFLVDYLNAYQSLKNRVVILDKNGVVAWSGHITGRDASHGQGAYDYGLTGIDRMSFGDAMEKFVLDGDEAEDYDADKKFNFAEAKSSMFSNSDKYPLLFTKLPEMNFVRADGKSIALSSLVNNKKPTVLVFYMSKADTEDTLSKDLDKAVDAIKMFSGRSTESTPDFPQDALQGIQEIYFAK